MVKTRSQRLADQFRDSSWSVEAESDMVNQLVDVSCDYNLRISEVVLAMCRGVAAVLTRDFRKVFTEEKVINKLVSLR